MGSPYDRDDTPASRPERSAAIGSFRDMRQSSLWRAATLEAALADTGIMRIGGRSCGAPMISSPARSIWVRIGGHYLNVAASRRPKGRVTLTTRRAISKRSLGYPMGDKPTTDEKELYRYELDPVTESDEATSTGLDFLVCLSH